MNTAGRKLAVMAVLAAAIACLGLGCAVSMPPTGHFKDMERRAGEGESEIVVNRTSRFTGSAAKMRVLIDNQECLLLNDGETGTVVVPDGRHSIYANVPMAREEAGRKRAITVDAVGSRIVFEAKYDFWKSDDFLWKAALLEKYMEIPLDGSNAPPSNNNYNTSQPNSAITSSGHGLPKIAVYVTSGTDKSMAAKVLASAGAHKTVGDGLAKAIGSVGKCDVVNLTGDITKAHGATVDEAQAAAIGSQFGVQYLCVVLIRDIKGKTFNLGVKLVDAASAKQVAAASAAVDLSNAAGLLQALAKIAAELVKGIAASAVQSVAQGAIGGGAAAAPMPADQPVQLPTPAPAAVPVSERPFIAVYVKGGIDDGMKSALCNELLFAIVKSGRYRSVNDNGEFIAAVKSEMERRGVSEMSDMQIAQTGEHVNADFVCVVNVSSVLGGYSVLARIIDVKNEAVAEMGRAAGTIAGAADVTETADRIAASMFGVSGEAAPQVTPEQQAAEVTPQAETPASRPKGPIKAAVYVTGIPPMVAKPLNSAISSALIKSKVYAGIESIDVSGTPSVPALADAGRNAGVSYIFAISVAGQISVAIIDAAESTELAKITIDGKITAVSAAVIAKKIVDFILTSGPKPDPDMQAAGETAVYKAYYELDSKPSIFKPSIEFATGGTYGSYKYSYDSPNSPDSGSGSKGGSSVYMRIDLIYFEMLLDGTVSGIGEQGGRIVFGDLVKYPFVFDQVPVRVTPMFGFGIFSVNDIALPTLILGGRINVDISEIAYLRSEYLYYWGVDLGDGDYYKGSNGMSLKAGGGLNVGFGKNQKAFWRTELMYNWISAYSPDKYSFDVKDEQRVNSKSATNYVDIKTGIGYKWGASKRSR